MSLELLDGCLSGATLLFEEADPRRCPTADVAILSRLGEGVEGLLRLLLLKIGDPGQELEISTLFTIGIGCRFGGQRHQILIALLWIIMRAIFSCNSALGASW